MARRRRTLLAVGGLVLASAACGGDDGDDGGRAASTIGEAVETLGCVEEDPGPAGLLRGTYACQLDREWIALHGTASQSDHGEALRALERRQAEADVVLCEGGTFPATVTVVDGSTWIAVTGSPATAEAVVERLGGVVQTLPEDGGPPIGYDATRFMDCD